MIRAILDEVVPADFVSLVGNSQIDVVAFPDAWRSLPDGKVLDLAAEAGYHWLITCDKQMPFQQNLTDKPLAVMVLPTQRILELEQIRPALQAVLTTPTAGNFIMLDRKGKLSRGPIPHMTGRKLTKN